MAVVGVACACQAIFVRIAGVDVYRTGVCGEEETYQRAAPARGGDVPGDCLGQGVAIEVRLIERGKGADGGKKFPWSLLTVKGVEKVLAWVAEVG